jgi:hypothetical protein
MAAILALRLPEAIDVVNIRCRALGLQFLCQPIALCIHRNGVRALFLETDKKWKKSGQSPSSYLPSFFFTFFFLYLICFESQSSTLGVACLY